MPIEPVKIPQNVYIEDRIIGPLTLRQTLIMAIGGGFSYAIFAMLQKAYGHVSIFVAIIVWIPALIAVMFALVKVNDLSLMRICFLLLERFNKSSVRTWTTRKGISINIRTAALIEEPPEKLKKQAEEVTKQKRIQELSSMIDTSLPEETVSPSEHSETAHMDADSKSVPVKSKENEPSKNAFPVDPKNISVDHGDLSAFRDIFPQSHGSL